MFSSVLRRAGGSWLFVGLLACLFLAGFTGSTFGFFDAETDNAATVAGGWVGAPTSQAVTASGYDGVVTWTTPDTTGVQGQRIFAHDNGTSTDCSSVTWDITVATGLPPTASTYTDSNRTASSGNGDQFCYRVQSYWTTNSWYHNSDTPAAQLGLAVQSVAISNGATAGKLDGGDTIALTFNQPPATPSNATLCTYHIGTGAVGIVFIGDATCSNQNSDPFVIAKLTNLTVGGVGHQKRSGTVSIAGNVMTVTVGQNGQNVTGAGSSTFTPSTSLVSAATSDQATVCTASPQCTPTPTGGF